MDNKRLLFAAARGARLQSRAFFEDWTTVSVSEALSDNIWNLQQRIHPDDVELQYGPISIALRKFTFNKLPSTFHTQLAFKIIKEYEENWIFGYETLDHRETFLLLISEIIADEGM